MLIKTQNITANGAARPEFDAFLQIHSVKSEGHFTRGYRSMNHGRKVLTSFKVAQSFMRCGLGAMLVAGFAQFALAQGGQTEVSKTTPSNPPPPAAAAAPAPVQPAAPADKPANPLGGTANWQTNAQPAQPAAPAAPAATPALAAPLQGNDAELVTKVNDYFNKLTDLQGTFLQTDPDNKQKHGKFYFEKPGKVRFDYGAPSRLRIISDGEYIAIEDHDLNTSDRYPLDMTPFRLLLAEKVDLINDAHVLSVEQGPDVVVVTVEDKKADGSGRVRLFFNKADMTLKEWIISDAQGLDTRIEVANLETNKPVPADLFQFSKDIGFKKD